MSLSPSPQTVKEAVLQSVLVARCQLKRTPGGYFLAQEGGLLSPKSGCRGVASALLRISGAHGTLTSYIPGGVVKNRAHAFFTHPRDTMKMLSKPMRFPLLVIGLALATGAVQAQPNWRAEPMYGTVNLNVGFTPDPHIVVVDAGGNNRNSISGSGCAGYINNAQPDVDLNYQAGRSRLYFYVKSGVDTTLLVNDANGNWLCSDDFEGSNPAIILNNPPSGIYNVWVGTYSQDDTGSRARLHISELVPRW